VPLSQRSAPLEDDVENDTTSAGELGDYPFDHRIAWHNSREGPERLMRSKVLRLTMNKPLSQLAGQYREWEPTVSLRDHLSCVWLNDLAHSSVNNFLVVPDGCVDIVWTGSGLYVAGPDTHPILEPVQRGSSVSGIRFRPGAAQLWLGMPLSEILNSRIPLIEFWKRDTGSLEEHISTAPDSIAAIRILEQVLLKRVARVGQADRLITYLRNKAANSNAIGVRELSRRMGISERTLRRRCIDAFGYGFKTLQGILRFQRFFRLAAHPPSPNMASLAFECGFADHSHMVREVRRFCNATPTELIAQFSR
jgi:AraC-like DNA-binding protein